MTCPTSHNVILSFVRGPDELGDFIAGIILETGFWLRRERVVENATSFVELAFEFRKIHNCSQVLKLPADRIQRLSFPVSDAVFFVNA